MAGPLSSEEIEDVVSSVRRLVSNELSPRRHSRDLGVDRLLLTPSLRVVSETSPLAPLILEERLPEAAVPDAEPAVEAAQDVALDDTVELVEAEWEDEIWPAPEVVPLGEVALAADEAEVLPLPDAAADSLPDTPEELSEHSQSGPLEAVASHPSDVGSAPVQSPPLDLAQDDLEADPVLPVEEVHAAPSHSALLSEDEEGVSASQRMPTEIIDADGTPLAVLDEAALQEIVRQMIREELQGDLGERITRNVRKLVRAEINRALMARDLD
jgi:cell pole-organizing protein PopZ